MGSAINIGGGGSGETTQVSDATATTKGIVKLGGDLGGTADAPTVPGLAKKLEMSGVTGGFYQPGTPAGTTSDDWQAVGGVFANKENKLWIKPVTEAAAPAPAPIIEPADGFNLNEAVTQLDNEFIDAEGSVITGTTPSVVTSRAFADALTMAVLKRDQTLFDLVLAGGKKRLSRSSMTTAKYLFSKSYDITNLVQVMAANGGDNLAIMGALIRAWNLWGRAADRDLASRMASDIKYYLVNTDEGRAYLVLDTDQKKVGNGHHDFNSGKHFALEPGGMQPVIFRMAKVFTGDTVFDSLLTGYYHMLAAVTANAGSFPTDKGLPPAFCGYDTAGHAYYAIVSGSNGWTITYSTDYDENASRTLCHAALDYQLFNEGKALNFLQGPVKGFLVGQYGGGAISHSYSHTGAAPSNIQTAITYLRARCALMANDISNTTAAGIKSTKLPTGMASNTHGKYFGNNIQGGTPTSTRDGNTQTWIARAYDLGLMADISKYGSTPNAGTTAPESSTPTTGGGTTSPAPGDSTTTPPPSDGSTTPGDWYAHGAAPSGLTAAQRRSIAKGEYNKFKTHAFTDKFSNPDGTNPVAIGTGIWRVQAPKEKFNNGQSDFRATVSEGIGYGMILTAFWGNPQLDTIDTTLRDPDAQTYFDGFWKFYNKYLNSNGFMHWCIDSKGNVNGQNGAADGDYDVAFALVMAHRIWGSAGAINYGQEATTLIKRILAKEIVPTTHATYGNVMTNGDGWGFDNEAYYPDYFRPAWFREFYKHTGDKRWLDIIDKNYPMAQGFFMETGKENSNINGLMTDIKRDGTRYGGTGPVFHYNNIRYPFSIAIDYLWNGANTNAYALSAPKRMIDRAKVVLGTDPVKPLPTGTFTAAGNMGIIAEPAIDYSYWGGAYRNASYVQAYGVAGTVHADHAAWAGACMSWLEADVEDNYFGRSLSAMSTLIMSGLMVQASPTSTGETTTPEPIAVPETKFGSPTAEESLYVDPDSTMYTYAAGIGDTNIKNRVLWAANHAMAFWTGANPKETDPAKQWDINCEFVKAYIAKARTANKTALVACYNIPNRDAGQYSAGGAANVDEYKRWIGLLATAIGDWPTVMIYEADAALHLNELSQEMQNDRIAVMNWAVQYLKEKCPNLRLYIDAGHSNWKSSDEVAGILTRVGVDKCEGFALNTSNFRPDAEIIAYGQQVAAKTNLSHVRFIYDTSRNGNQVGPVHVGEPNSDWCNPAKRQFGRKPKYGATGVDKCDGWIWGKRPGESDGTNFGAPKAGEFWSLYIYNPTYGDNVDSNDPRTSSGMCQRPPTPGVTVLNANNAPG